MESMRGRQQFASISFGEESHRLCHYDHFKLAKRILRFALDAQLRQEVGAANRARTAMFFSPERMWRKSRGCSFPASAETCAQKTQGWHARPSLYSARNQESLATLLITLGVE